MHQADHVNAVDAIGALDAIAFAAGALLDHPDPRAHAVGLWLADGGDAALFTSVANVENRQGRSAMLEARVERRNRALIDAANLLYPNLPVSERARLLAEQLGRYHAAGWRREQIKTINPHPEGSARAMLWQALKAHARPPGASHMRRILAAHQP